MKVGIFGGSFNPPHIGHLMACQYVLALNDLDRIWIVPVREHPFNKPMLNFWMRYELCVKTFHNSYASIMNFDHKFMIDLLRHLTETKPYYSYSLIVGSDICTQWADWKDYDKIKELVPIIVVPRGEQGACALPDISSTEIRERLKNGQDVSNLIPRAALEYITHNKLEF